MVHKIFNERNQFHGFESRHIRYIHERHRHHQQECLPCFYAVTVKVSALKRPLEPTTENDHFSNSCLRHKKFDELNVHPCINIELRRFFNYCVDTSTDRCIVACKTNKQDKTTVRSNKKNTFFIQATNTLNILINTCK